MPRPCDHPTGPPRPDACAVCRRYLTSAAYRDWCDRRGPARPKPLPAPPRDPPPPPGPGPGTELAGLLAGLGLDMGGCRCAARARQMNAWGPAGCRARRAEVVGWLRAEARKRGWWARVRAAGRAVLNGTAFALNPLDPLGSLVDEAVRRAEANAGGVTVPTTDPAGPDWACGVTTVPERRGDLLPRTLASLARAGFDRPRLFVDGCTPAQHAEYLEALGLPTTPRWPRTNVVVSWQLALHELYLRHPAARLYALFQDDVEAVGGLRRYLEAGPPPPGTWLNLVTFKWNERAVGGRPPGWHPAADHPTRSAPGRPVQLAQGALGYVFTRDAVQVLLAARPFIERVTGTHFPDRNLDGCVGEALNAAGYVELVHSPSLLTHRGEASTIGPANDAENGPVAPGGPRQDRPLTWPGEGWEPPAAPAFHLPEKRT